MHQQALCHSPVGTSHSRTVHHLHCQEFSFTSLYIYPSTGCIHDQNTIYCLHCCLNSTQCLRFSVIYLKPHNQAFSVEHGNQESQIWNKVINTRNSPDLHNNLFPDDMLVVLYFMVVSILCGFLQTSSGIPCQWMVGF